MDRLQILRVARLEKFAQESKWYHEIEAHRTELWAQIVRDLNRVVAHLNDGETDAIDTVRMADWNVLATVIGETLGEGDAIREALAAAELDKAHFLLEADDLYDLIHDVVTDFPGRKWKAGELFAELNRRAENADIQFTIKSPRSLGRILNRLAPALRRMITFEISADTHDKQSTYLLGPLPEPEDPPHVG